MPSERDLAETFEVSRMTLRQAITLLVEEGVHGESVAGLMSQVHACKKRCVVPLALQKL